MSRATAEPPHAAPCLQRRRECKGGTLIAEDVTTLDAHRARVCDPDGYRPQACARCGFRVLHVHDYRGRVLVAVGSSRLPGAASVVDVARYACARGECGAIWQVLPALLARHLWRAWKTVETATLDDAGEPSAPIPARTRKRWMLRLLSPALLLVQLFATETGSTLEALAKRVGLEATRHALVLAYAAESDAASGSRLSSVAAITNRLARSVRLM
jgi:hypothetical protein